MTILMRSGEDVTLEGREPLNFVEVHSAAATLLFINERHAMESGLKPRLSPNDAMAATTTVFLDELCEKLNSVFKFSHF